MPPYCDKKVAYVDRRIGDEILEIEDVDVLPRRQQPIRFDQGDGKGNWTVYDVRSAQAESPFDAIVLLDRRG